MHGSSQYSSQTQPKTLFCVQKAGDLLYLPEGWHHAVYNLDRVLAVAAQPRVPYQRGLALLNALHSTLGANQLGEANEVGAKVACITFMLISVDLNIGVLLRVYVL